VDECLDDVAMRLRRYTTPVPRSLAPYLVRALRLHRLAQRRGEGRRVDKRAEAAAPSSDLASVLEATVSEAAMRDSAGPDHERTPASAALERLSSMVEEGLSDEEEMILSWVSRWVPQSHIAEWLGISHGAARNRVMRLRARLKDAAIRHVASFTGRERTELMDFFRRTFPASRYRQIADSLEEPAPPPAPPPRARTGTDRGSTDA
jgi:DNA-directed RNA polymerase specialized sigma24 family protein